MSANGYSPRGILKNSSGVTLGANESDTVISNEAPIYASGSIRLRVNMVAESVTASAGITVQAQHFLAGSWADLTSANSSVAITGNGVFEIKLLVERAADQADMPLGEKFRLVCTTGAGDAVTFSRIDLLQGL